MKRILIISGIILFVFFILLLILYFLIKSFLTEERIRKFSEDKIKEATGLSCKIEKVVPYIGIKGVGIDIKNLKLYKEKEVASSERILFKIKLIPIIFKKIEIDKIYIEKPFFEYKIKKGEIEKVKKEEISEKEIEIPFIFFLKNLEIRNGKFKIYDDEKIEISNFNLNLKGILKKNLIEIKGENDFEVKVRDLIFPLKDKFKINYDLKNDLANIENFSIYLFKNELNLKGNIKGIISGETEYNVYLTSDNFNLQNLPEILKELKILGILKIDLNLKGKENPFIYGKIKSKDIEIVYLKEKLNFRDFESEFKGDNFSFSFKGIFEEIDLKFDGIVKFFPLIYFEMNSNIKGNLKKFTNLDKIFEIKVNLKGEKNKGKIKAKFLSGKNDLNIDADLNFDKKIEVSGNISSFYFNLDEILKKEEKKEKKEKEEIPFLLPPNLKIDINCFIKEFLQKNNVLRNVRFKLKGEENNIRIENFKGEAFEGIIEGNFSLRKGSFLLDIELSARNINFLNLLPNLKFLPFKITGILNINSKTSMNLENIFETINSQNFGILVKGYIEGNKVLKKIAEITKVKELEKIYFDNIDFKIEIKKGFIYFPDFKIKGKDFEIVPKGKVSLKGDMDMDALINFKNLSFNLNIKGNYENPNIKIYSYSVKKEVKKIEKEIKKEIKKEVKKEVEKLKKKLRR